MKKNGTRKHTSHALIIFFSLMLIILIGFGVILKLYLNRAFIDLCKFDWSGVAGISSILVVILNFFLLTGIFLAYLGIQESAKIRTLEVLEIA